jgi:hypothetical protein
MNLFRTKSTAQLQAEAAGDQRLNQTLTATNLISLGISAAAVRRPATHRSSKRFLA